MKYYKDTENNIYANPLKLEGLVEIDTPIFNGKVLPKHKNIGSIDTKEDGSFYTYYNEDGTVDTTKEAEANQAKLEANVKSAIAKAIATMRVEVNGLFFDGDEASTSRMQKAITTLVGTEPITWRMYDNSIETITQTELGKALRASGIKMTELWFCTSVAEVDALVGLDSIWLEKYNG